MAGTGGCTSGRYPTPLCSSGSTFSDSSALISYPVTQAWSPWEWSEACAEQHRSSLHQSSDLTPGNKNIKILDLLCCIRTCNMGQLHVLRADTFMLYSNPTRDRSFVWGIRGSSQFSCCLPMLVQSSSRPTGCFCTVMERRWELIFWSERFGGCYIL